jgi:hypothetical protein
MTLLHGIAGKELTAFNVTTDNAAWIHYAQNTRKTNRTVTP